MGGHIISHYDSLIFDHRGDQLEVGVGVHWHCRTLPWLKQYQDHIDSVGEPFHDLLEFIATLDALLLSRQDTRGVDKRHAIEHFAIQLGAFKTLEQLFDYV